MTDRKDYHFFKTKILKQNIMYKEANETVGVASQLVSFGAARLALNLGKRVKKLTWGEDRKFIFRQVPSSVPSKFVANMTSLPQSVKDYFEETFEFEQIDAIYYSNQIALVGLSNMITSWSPSVEDIFGDDWIILD
jgi:hypothetical protein